MPFHITCVCGHLTVVPDEAAGQSLCCSRCNAALSVPDVDAPKPPPIPPPVATDQPVVVVASRTSPARHAGKSQYMQAIQLVAGGLVALALLSAIPIFLVMPQSTPDPLVESLSDRILAPWSVVIMLAAILHLAYAIYLLQTRDYGCVWVVSVFLLAVSTGYAMLLGMRMLATQGNRFLALLQLDSSAFPANQQTLWCFLMMTLTGVMCYLAGRTASRLHVLDTGLSRP